MIRPLRVSTRGFMQNDHSTLCIVSDGYLVGVKVELLTNVNAEAEQWRLNKIDRMKRDEDESILQVIVAFVLKDE